MRPEAKPGLLRNCCHWFTRNSVNWPPLAWPTNRIIPPSNRIVGQDLADWWSQDRLETDRSLVAWEGTNEASQKVGRKIRLFKTTWENPSPETEIKSIDFLSSHGDAAPFLVAITVE